MDKEYFDELKNKITDYVEANKKESYIIGGFAAVALGYFTYKLLSRSKTRDEDDDDYAAGEDEVKELEQTPGKDEHPDEEGKEGSKNNPRYTDTADSEDEPLLLRMVVKPQRDAQGVLDRDTLIRIFDKRSTIRGIRNLDKTFREKRRAVFDDQVEYKKLISYYHYEIEKKREQNLEYICKAIGIKIEDIENSQEKYFGDKNLAFIVGTKELEKYKVPSWLTLDKALAIYDNIKEMLQSELIQLNFKQGLGEEARNLEMVYIQYKIQDVLYNKYKVEEEHVKKVLYENGMSI